MKSTVIKYANVTLLQSQVMNKHSSNIIHLICPVSVAVCKFNVSGFGCHPLAMFSCKNSLSSSRSPTYLSTFFLNVEESLGARLSVH